MAGMGKLKKLSGNYSANRKRYTNVITLLTKKVILAP